jgi:hypothetical protein
MRSRRAPLTCIFAAACLLCGAAQAQDAAPAAPQGAGFGERDAFLFSVERIFGFQSQKSCVDDSCQTLDSVGLHPFYWGHIGLFSQQTSGLNYGSLVGFTYLKDGFGDDDVAILRLGPRIGYAGSLQPALGYWLRGGPSLFAGFSDGDDAFSLAASFEAMAVVVPVPHFGLLFGPNVDIHLWGEQGDVDYQLSAIGFSAGLMGEF